MTDVLRVWFMAAALFLFVMQPWSYSIGPVPIQVILIWAAFGLSFNLQKWQKIFTPGQLFLISVGVASVFFRLFFQDENLKVLFQLLTGIALGYVGGSLAFSASFKSLSRVLTALVIAATISAFIAILEKFGHASWAWSHTLYYGHRGQWEPSGLESSPVPFAYSVAPVCVFLITTLFMKDKLFDRAGVLMASAAILMMVGLYCAGSRSGMLSVVLSSFLGLFIADRMNLTRISFYLVVFSMGIAALIIDLSFLGVLDHFLRNYKTDMRMGGTWLIFLPTILEYPLGIPLAMRQAAMEDKIAKNSQYLAYQKVMTQTGGYDPHNILLTTALFYGIPAAIALFSIYVSPFFKLPIVLRSKNPIAKKWFVAFFSANLAVFIHSWFHNASILFGEMRNWIWLGGMLGLISMIMYGTTTGNSNTLENNDDKERQKSEKLFDFV